MIHKPELKQKFVGTRKLYYVTCNCGYEDPAPGGLIGIGDAETSLRDHARKAQLKGDSVVLPEKGE